MAPMDLVSPDDHVMLFRCYALQVEGGEVLYRWSTESSRFCGNDPTSLSREGGGGTAILLGGDFEVAMSFSCIPILGA